jgi:predicted ATP-grasp superfamily ATP-dependent carboligase
LNLLVYEHVSGGGFADQKIPAGILCEGFGMLRSLISDFKRAGHNITTLIDSRLATFNPPLEADKIISISSPNNFEKSLKKALKLSDAAYFVAPESDQSLQRLVKEAEDVDKTTLNCQVSAINTTANKTTTYEALRKVGVSFPETLTFSLNESAQQVGQRIGDLSFPLIFKPLTGVSCQGISMVNNENEIKMAINKIKAESSNEFFLIQKLVAGVAASASLISTGVEAAPITLNEQLLTLESSSSQLSSAYYGGVVPLQHMIEKTALQTAKKAVEAFGGLKGYVGVDMVLTREGPVVMEINPRLTTSYVGLTKVVDFNPAQAIIDAVIERKFPRNVQVSGCTYFSKVKIKPPTYEALLKSYGLGEVVSPPFPIGDDSETYALLASKADELETAKVGFEMAQKHLDNIVSKG